MADPERTNGKTKWQKVKSFLRLTPEGATPVPWKIIGLVVFALYGSCYSITFLFPYVPNMILWFGYKEEEKGYYAGLVASSMFAGRICGSYFWGWLSDQKGRKPIILASLILTMITNFLFGFSVNVAMAITIRFFNGLFNGIIGTGKTILYEVSDNTNQGVGMSSISLAWGGGIIMGPLISGYLAEPAKRYPSVFSESGLFGRFPFLLPALLAGFMCILPIVLLWWKLPETRKRQKPVVLEVNQEDRQRQENEKEIADESRKQPNIEGSHNAGSKSLNLSAIPSHVASKSFTASLYSLQHADSVVIPRHDDTSPVYGYGCLATSHGDLLLPDMYGDHMTSTPLKKEFSHSLARDLPGYVRSRSTRSLNCSTKSLNHVGVKYEKSPLAVARPLIDPPIETGQSQEAGPAKLGFCDRLKKTDVYKVLTNREARMSIAIYFTVSFGVIGYEEVFTVFASTKRSLGGFAFTPVMIGNALGVSSVPLLLLSIFLFPWLERKFGAKRVFNGFCLYMISIAALLPCLRVILHEEVAFWTLLLVGMGLRGIAVTTCFSANGLHINNSVPPSMAGSANGIAITFTAIGRMLAPTVGGSIFAWSITRGAQIGFPFDINLVFILFSAVYFVGNVLCALLPDSLDKQRKKDGGDM